jgi:integrase
MASVISDPNGRKRIQFMAGDGTRRTIRLGRATLRQAEGIKVRVEQLVLAATGAVGVVDEDTIKWLASLSDKVYSKLAGVGLVGRREALRLGEFLTGYIEGRTDIKAGTAIVLWQSAGNLTDFFGASKNVREITEDDAEQWRRYLIEQGLSDATVRKRCGNAKQFFRVALKRRLIPSNPFAELESSSKANKTREYFVSLQDAQKVLEACPDAEWRLLFALCRFEGVRCPSEVLTLKWTDVNWEQGRILIHSPKTEHHAGGESRLIPLFPELLPYLQAVFDEAEPGTEYVITRYRQPNVNLRTQLQRIIRKAGLKPWPRLFQNLRSTRETELAEKFPLHVVTAWIGNSQLVARKHYLQVTEEHFAKAAQNQAQQAHAEPCIASHADGEPTKFHVKRDPAMVCERGVGDIGFEPMTSRV